jgi:gamma-glutamylcyclotransferase (GGCT)/AIG2-like uncharacterized protein YtfP
MPLVFVYGTLMRGRRNHAVLERLAARFIADATTCDRRTLVDLGPYPALLPTTADPVACVSGEVWQIGLERLAELDAFEGCPDLYTRERIALVTGSDADSDVEAFVYVLARRPPARARVLTTGRYEGVGVALPNGAAADPIDPSSGSGSLELDNPAPTEDRACAQAGPDSSVGRAGD